MEHIVTSKDGIQFLVNSAEKSVAYDRAFAASKSTAELAAHGDFTQIKSLDDLFTAEELRLTEQERRQLPVQLKHSLVTIPRISGPLERRAAFKVIKGGKAS